MLRVQVEALNCAARGEMAPEARGRLLQAQPERVTDGVQGARVARGEAGEAGAAGAREEVQRVGAARWGDEVEDTQDGRAPSQPHHLPADTQRCQCH